MKIGSDGGLIASETCTAMKPIEQPDPEKSMEVDNLESASRTIVIIWFVTLAVLLALGIWFVARLKAGGA